MSYPDYPGPQDAEPGTIYRRESDAESDLFRVESVDERPDGTIVVTGRFEKQ